MPIFDASKNCMLSNWLPFLTETCSKGGGYWELVPIYPRNNTIMEPIVQGGVYMNMGKPSLDIVFFEGGGENKYQFHHIFKLFRNVPYFYYPRSSFHFQLYLVLCRQQDTRWNPLFSQLHRNLWSSPCLSLWYTSWRIMGTSGWHWALERLNYSRSHYKWHILDHCSKRWVTNLSQLVWLYVLNYQHYYINILTSAL